MEAILHEEVELPMAFQLLDQRLLQNRSYRQGVADAYRKNVDPQRCGKGKYAKGVEAGEALMLFFLQSGDHDKAFVESLFPSLPSEPEMLSLTSPDVTRLAAPLSASLKVVPEFMYD